MLLMLAACGPMNSPQTQPLPESKPVEGTTVAAKPSKAVPKGSTKTDAPKRDGDKMDSVAKEFLDAHNRLRAKHCAAPLTWSKKLADVAQKWANTLRDKGCVFGHSPGAKYGENLAAGTQGALDPTTTVDMWYDEIKLYKFPNGGFSMQTGHFTQVVWRSTQQVGCGHVTCKGNDVYVCNYDPAGNWEGKYRSEVLPASCKK
jgi:uncharacterized protein YkwD